jgi:potassium/hydrogen antiporter
VRDVDDKGKITGLGLSFEPTAPVARVPVFLSAGEIGDRLGALIRNWRKPADKQAVEDVPIDHVASAPEGQKATSEG